MVKAILFLALIYSTHLIKNNATFFLSEKLQFVHWKPDITGMVGPEQKSLYSRSLLHPKSRETRTD